MLCCGSIIGEDSNIIQLQLWQAVPAIENARTLWCVYLGDDSGRGIHTLLHYWNVTVSGTVGTPPWLSSWPLNRQRPRTWRNILLALIAQSRSGALSPQGGYSLVRGRCWPDICMRPHVVFAGWVVALIQSLTMR